MHEKERLAVVVAAVCIMTVVASTGCITTSTTKAEKPEEPGHPLGGIPLSPALHASDYVEVANTSAWVRSSPLPAIAYGKTNLILNATILEPGWLLYRTNLTSPVSEFGHRAEITITPLRGNQSGPFVVLLGLPAPGHAHEPPFMDIFATASYSADPNAPLIIRRNMGGAAATVPFTVFTFFVAASHPMKVEALVNVGGEGEATLDPFEVGAGARVTAEAPFMRPAGSAPADASIASMATESTMTGMQAILVWTPPVAAADLAEAPQVRRHTVEFSNGATDEGQVGVISRPPGLFILPKAPPGPFSGEFTSAQVAADARALGFTADIDLSRAFPGANLDAIVVSYTEADPEHVP